MALTVLTPYVTNRVSDPVTVELQTGLMGRTAERLLDVVSSMFESYCDRVFAKQRYRETLGVDGANPVLQLQRVPLVFDETTDPITVTLRTQTITDFTIQDLERGWLYRERGWAGTGFIGGLITRHPLPIQPQPNYTVEYSAGWIMPGERGRNFPRDLEGAAWQAINHLAQLTGAPLGDTEANDAFDTQLFQTLRRMGMTGFRSGDTQLTWAATGPGTGVSAGGNNALGATLSTSGQVFPIEVIGVLDRYRWAEL